MATRNRKASPDDAVISLSAAQAQRIHEALIIGLAAWGEVERLSSAQELAEIAGPLIADELRVINPVGDPEMISKFAAALREVQLPAESFLEEVAHG